MKILSRLYIGMKDLLLKVMVIAILILVSPFLLILWLDKKLDKREDH